MKKFDYLLYGHEVDEYCYILIDKYGDNSNVVQCLDKNYYRLVNSSHIYVEQLNAIRQFLNGNGFNREITYADEVFTSIIENRFREVSKYSGMTNLELRQKKKEMAT